MSSPKRTLVAAAAAIGLGAACTSLYVHYRLVTDPSFTSFCDVNTTVSCTEAYLSPYGHMLGVPVALLGALWFAVVLAIALAGWKKPTADPAPGYIFLLSLPALGIIGYLAYAAFAVLHAVCILCAITYVAVVTIAVVSWRASTVPIGSLPSRAGDDLPRALRSPITIVLGLVLVAATAVVATTFPVAGTSAVAAPVEALPAVSDADMAKLAAWWDLQPKVDLPVDSGGKKVVVVKFNDYQCPPCRLTYDAYNPIFAKHASDVTFALKHFPLEPECNAAAPGGGHFAACEAAAAVNMARKKGTAEKLEAWLFANQGPPILNSDQVRDAARRVGGIEDFEAQYAATLQDVRADAALGARLGVGSTPTFYINGRKVPEILQPQYFNALIEIELKRP